MDKHAVAIVLEEIGTLLEIQGENRFKARAFAGAARALEKLERDLNTVVREGGLESISGIGPATAAVIGELVTTGTSRYYRELREGTPPGLLELLAVPRLGATRIRTLHEELGINSVDDLERAARSGRIATLKGFGMRTEKQILEGVADVRGSSGRRRYADAIELGLGLRGFVAALPGVLAAQLAGELRRGCETVAGIDVIAAVEANAAAAALAAFRALPGLTSSETLSGQTVSARLADGIELRFCCVPAAEFATALVFATGSVHHLAALSEQAQMQDSALASNGLLQHGQTLSTAREEDVYSALGLEYVAPELRETGAEVVAARAGHLPALIEQDDLRGCFHCHTTYSDGKATVAQMAEAAQARGWRYLGIADHSQYAGYAGGLSPDEIYRQHKEIDNWNQEHGRKLWLFKGIEADILPDGRLDYQDRPELLASFDFVIGSVHSAFGLSAAAQTQRFLRVLENPYLTMLGHLTGRLLLARRGCNLDLETVLVAAAQRGVAIEINSDPHRMELDWRHWPRAKELGIRAAINPDAHSPRQLDFVRYGTVIARKGWLEGRDVVNTWTLSEVKRFFRQARRT